MINHLSVMHTLQQPTDSTSVQYASAFGNIGGYDTTEAHHGSLIPPGVNIILTDMIVELFVGPGVGKTVDYTLRDNGVDTAATFHFTNSAAAMTASWSGYIVLAAGHLITISETPTSTPSLPARNVRIGYRWVSDDNSQQCFTHIQGQQATTAGVVSHVDSPMDGGFTTWSGSGNIDEGAVIASDCVLSNLSVKLSDSPAGGTVTVTALRDPYSGGANTGEVASSVVVVCSDTNVTSDTTHTQAYEQGSRIMFKIVQTSAVPAERVFISYKLTPTIPGDCQHMGEFLPGNSANSFGSMKNSSFVAAAATEQKAYMPVAVDAMTMKNLFMRACDGTGGAAWTANIASGQNVTLTARKNAASVSGAVTAAVSNGQYANDTTNTVLYVGRISSFDRWDFNLTSSASAGTNSTGMWGCVFNVPQPTIDRNGERGGPRGVYTGH